MIYTKENENILAFYKHNDTVYRVIDYVEDFKIENVNGSDSRWFSTHSAISLLPDIQLALSSYLGCKVLQKDINLTA